jgi:hypothetical protein
MSGVFMKFNDLRYIYLKILILLLIGLLSNPPNMRSQNHIWQKNGTDHLSDNQKLTVGVDLVPLRVIPKNGVGQQLIHSDQSQLIIGHYPPPAPGDGNQYHLFYPMANYAEFEVDGAEGYEFNFTITWTTDAYLTNPTSGVHLTMVTLYGAYDYQLPHFTTCRDQDNGNITLGSTDGKYYFRASVSEIKLDVGVPHGDYQFPVTMAVEYTGLW